MFKIYLLSSLLSWLFGMFVILTTSFFVYEAFSIIDITSFAVLTCAGCLILIPLIYLSILRYLKNKVKIPLQFIYFPACLVLIANLPAYYLIWRYTNDLYSRSEAILFTIAYIAIGVVFGVVWARKNKLLTI